MSGRDEVRGDESLDVRRVQTRGARAAKRDQVSRNSDVSGWTDKSWRILLAPERLYFAFAGIAMERRHRRHRLFLLLFLLLPQEQRRDADIDTDVTARADIDSNSDAS